MSVLAHDVTSPAQDHVPAARAAVRALQGQGHRGAQGEHVRRGQDWLRAQAEPAGTGAAVRARHHEPRHEVQQEERARQDHLPDQILERKWAQTQNIVHQTKEYSSHPETELEQDRGGWRREGEGEPALGGRHGEPARLHRVGQAQQAQLLALRARLVHAQPRAGVVLVGRAAGRHVGGRGGRHGAGRGRRPGAARQAPPLPRARAAAAPQEDPPQAGHVAPAPPPLPTPTQLTVPRVGGNFVWGAIAVTYAIKNLVWSYLLLWV